MENWLPSHFGNRRMDFQGSNWPLQSQQWFPVHIRTRPLQLGPRFGKCLSRARCGLKRSPRERHSCPHTQVKCSRLEHCEPLGSPFHPWEKTASKGTHRDSLFKSIHKSLNEVETLSHHLHSAQGEEKGKAAQVEIKQATYVLFTLSVCIDLYLSIYTYIHIHLCI